MTWWLWLICLTFLFLLALRFAVIEYSKRVPNIADQDPHFIDPSDKSQEAYRSSTEWLKYEAKRDELSETSKKAELRMFKNNTNTYRTKDIKGGNRLNFNKLKNVIGINQKEEYADVEGSITYDSFSYSILKYGYIPTVVPELKSITVGGAIVGGGIESSSFKFGLVHESLIECDVLLANGDVVTCNNNADNKYRDLFRAIPNSLGSLGYILRARMKIVKAKQYVALRNVLCRSYDELADMICRECNSNREIDFIEGVAYWNGTGRILMGSMVDALPKGVKCDEYTVFHSYVERAGKDSVMYMPVDEYLWRWDSDLFWCIKNIAPLQWRLVRWYLSRHVMRSDVLRHLHQKLFGRDITVQNKKQKKAGNNMFIQDIIVPEKHVKGWLKFHFDEVLYIKTRPQIDMPLWLCPTIGNEKDYTLMSVNEKTINVNFGFWSSVKWDKDMELNEFVEDNLDRFGALKILYSTVMLAKERFYKIYNGKEYFKLKEKYDKNTRIRHFYDKCTQK